MACKQTSATVSVAFVDLFACGLGAVLVFWLMLVASEPKTREGPGKLQTLVLRVVPGEPNKPLADIGVMGEVGGEVHWPDRASKNANPKLIFPQRSPGGVEFTILFNIEKPAAKDVLRVFLHDLKQTQRSDVVHVQWTLHDPKRDKPITRQFELDWRSQPMVGVSIRDLLNPSILPKWEHDK